MVRNPEAAATPLHLPEIQGNRSQKRAAKLVSPVLRRVLRTTEQTLAVVEAVRVAGWKSRLMLGGSWPFAHRVALVFTDRRLLEVALGPWARSATGEVREISWSALVLPRVEGRSLFVGEGRHWWLRHAVDAAALTRIEEQARGATTPLRRGTAVQEWRLCVQCGATMRDRDRSCQRCGTHRTSTRLAGFLSLAFPGAGMLYLGHPSYALTRFLTELVLYLLYAGNMLRADGFAMKVMVCVVGLVVLLLIKLEALAMTRLLAYRAGGRTGARSPGAWRKRAALGLLVSLILLALPLVLASSMSTRITGDLGAQVPFLGWEVSRDPATWHSSSPSMRAEWRHSSGLTVQATAVPLPPFISPRRARLHWTETYGGKPGVAVERVTLGHHRALEIVRVSRAADGGPPRATLSYLLVDDYGRDEHRLDTIVPRTELDDAESTIEQLIACLYWIPARQLSRAPSQ